MPIDFNADLNEIEEREGGTGLRKFAEAAQADWRKTQVELTNLKAERLIQEHGYHLVTAEDLAGVPLSDLESRAEAVEAEKLESQRALARDMLARKGIEGDELDRAVDELLAPTPDNDKARQRAAAASRAGGVPTPLVDVTQLHGVEAIRHGLIKST
jgi:hypothetical protein